MGSTVALVALLRRHPLFKAPSWMPVYLPLIGAVLRQAGHTVRYIEAYELGHGRLPLDPATWAPHVADADAVLFDVQLQLRGQLQSVFAAVRQAAPRATLLAGGRDAASAPQALLTHCAALDGVLRHEGETPMAELLGGTPPDRVTGLCWRGAAEHATGTGAVEDLDALPLPAWDLLDMAYYTRATPRVIPCLRLRTATLQSARGCTGACRFCNEGRLNASRYRTHSAAYVVAAIDKLMRDYAIDGLYFSDECFLTDRERVFELCDALRSTGLANRLKWCAQVRADTVDREILAIMARAGCVQLEIGVETGSQRLLDALGKQTTVEVSESAIRAVREAGIRAMAYLMIGIPGETPEDVRQTASLLDRARPDVTRLSTFTLFPGTPMADALVRAGELPMDFWWRPPSQRLHAVRPRDRRDLYFGHVLPRFARDYARHGVLPGLARDICLSRLPGFLFTKMRGDLSP